MATSQTIATPRVVHTRHPLWAAAGDGRIAEESRDPRFLLHRISVSVSVHRREPRHIDRRAFGTVIRDRVSGNESSDRGRGGRHPKAHLLMDWENKTPGEVIGASHLVHEYIGPHLEKLRIQFIRPQELLPGLEDRTDRWVICARAGLLEQPINVSTMCHNVRDTEWGAEMRLVFWMGDVSKRQGNETVSSIEGLVGNTASVRMLPIREERAVDLMTHAIQEMGYLADFLPELCAAETGEGARPRATPHKGIAEQRFAKLPQRLLFEPTRCACYGGKVPGGASSQGAGSSRSSRRSRKHRTLAERCRRVG